jgi:hypothetical protein
MIIHTMHLDSRIFQNKNNKKKSRTFNYANNSSKNPMQRAYKSNENANIPDLRIEHTCLRIKKMINV